MLQIYLLHVLFGKPVSTHRVKPEGMLFGDMLYSSRSTSRSDGNNFIHSSATMTVPMPPRAAAGTAPSNQAAMPLSNSPS